MNLLIIRYFLLVSLIFYCLVTIFNYFSLNEDENNLYKHNVENISKAQYDILIYVITLLITLIFFNLLVVFFFNYYG